MKTKRANNDNRIKKTGNKKYNRKQIKPSGNK